MKLALSGFAGGGKSSIIDKVKENYKNVFIFPESAREVNYTKDFYIIKNDKENEFFQKSVMDNEIMKILLSNINNIENAIFDRSIIDNFAFAEIFYGSDRVNYIKFNEFINYTCEKYNKEFLYDKIIFIRSTENEDFIRNNILNDEFRKDTTSHNVKEFIKKSKEWENIYLKIFNENNKIAKDIFIINHFIDDIEYNNKVKIILDDCFLK